ncbi:NAD(P)H-hydrate epimerase [Exophiala dermatitidis]
MALKTLGAKKAADLDKDLMSEDGGFSLDQLMELAGLSVAEAVYRVHPPSKGKNILIAAGPGNNGGDGLVCARHLYHFGYTPQVYYPKPTNAPIFNGLQKQLNHLHIPFLKSLEDFTTSLNSSDLIVDALFGFSFKPPVRAPFDTVLSAIIDSKKPVLAVDIPSSWDVEAGPPEQGQLGSEFMPQYLVSLTAAKPCVKHFKGQRHFIGGRFLSTDVASKYGLDVPLYEGVDQIAEVPVDAKVEKL